MKRYGGRHKSLPPYFFSGNFSGVTDRNNSVTKKDVRNGGKCGTIGADSMTRGKDSMNLREMLIKARKDRGLSQEELARQIGVSRSAVAKWESGRGIPDIENIMRLAQVFHMTVDELLQATPQEKTTTGKPAYKDCFMQCCTVTLSDWNDGPADAYPVGEDDRFLFYICPEKSSVRIGAVAKSYIVKIEVSDKKSKEDLTAFQDMGRRDFIHQTVDIDLDSRRFLDGLIGPETEYRDIYLADMTEDSLYLGVFHPIPLEKVTKIERHIGG